MKLTKINYWNSWMKNGRAPARPVTRFKADKPMVLRDSVSEARRLDSDVVCIQEMMEMLSCFKDNEFDQNNCQNQMNAFQKCYDKHLEDKRERKSHPDQTQPTPGQNKLTKDQLNVLLKRWRQPK